MKNGTEAPVYLLLKWIWLVYQALILPFAALYLSTPQTRLSVIPLGRIVLFLLGAAFLVLWLIAQSLLAMYRFPLGTPAARRLVSGHVLQFVLILLTGTSWTFAFYLSFFTTLTAIVLMVLILSAWKLLARPGRWFRVFLFIALAFFCLLFLQIFIGPLLIGFSGLLPWQKALDIAAIAANIGFTVHALYGFSIFARPGPPVPQFDLEWQRWAPATVIVLILSAAAAVVVAGIRGIQ
jgi:hypothetical protein